MPLIDMAALRPPGALGLKLTAMAQFAPGAKLEPQLLLWLKSAALEPWNPMPLMVNTPFPLFVRTVFLEMPALPTF